MSDDRMAGDSWRWAPGRHRARTHRTIVVSELSEEQKAERERKIAEGAHVVPFGFARALADDDEADPGRQPPEPLMWEGDYA